MSNLSELILGTEFSDEQKSLWLKRDYRVNNIKIFIEDNLNNWEPISDLILNPPQNKFFNEIRFTIFIFLIDYYESSNWKDERVYATFYRYFNELKNLVRLAPLEAAYFLTWKCHSDKVEEMFLEIIHKGKSMFGREAALYGIFEYYKERNNLKSKKQFFKLISETDRSKRVRSMALNCYHKI